MDHLKPVPWWVALERFDCTCGLCLLHKAAWVAGSECERLRDLPQAGGCSPGYPGGEQHLRGRAHPEGVPRHHQVLQSLPAGRAVPKAGMYNLLIYLISSDSSSDLFDHLISGELVVLRVTYSFT